ncbi:MAG: hypothetical protein IJP27_09750 [Clostridia bacterium]|nr:hypothetical protein [Clostridia bacterium]
MRKKKDEQLDEIIELEEESQERRSGATIKYIRYLLLLAMVVVALIFLFANREQINGDNFRRMLAKFDIGFSASGSEDGEVHFDTASGGNTVVFKDGFAHATVEKLIITDKNGTEFQNIQLGFRKPMISANNRYVLAYDSGGVGLMVTDSFSVLFETTFEDPIITARMNKNGSFAVVTEGDGFLAKVYVFNASFKEIYRYRSMNRYILDAVVAENDKALAVSAVNIEGADIVPEIMYFKLSKESVEWTVPFTEDPCVRIAVKDNGTVCGLFNWGMVSLNEKGKEVGRYQLDNQVIQCYSLDDGKDNIFVVSAAENGDGRVVVCNEKGEVEDTVELDYYAVHLDYLDGRVAVLGNQKSGVYTRSGKLLWEASPERATDISFMGKNTVVVVSETKCVYNGI